MKLNSFQLKIFAMILMVLDHVVTYIPNMPVWFNWVGRVVAPIFFFFIVEGFYHTRSNNSIYFIKCYRSKYIWHSNDFDFLLFKR